MAADPAGSEVPDWCVWLCEAAKPGQADGPPPPGQTEITPRVLTAHRSQHPERVRGGIGGHHDNAAGAVGERASEHREERLGAARAAEPVTAVQEHSQSAGVGWAYAEQG